MDHTGEIEGMSLSGGLDYAVVFNATSNGMAISELDSGRIVDVNAAWIRSTGIERGKSIGRTALELGLWASRAAREACIAEIEKKGRVVDFEAVLILRSVHVPHLISAELFAMGGKRYVLWEFRDITALIENEEKVKSLLAASEQSRRTLLGILEDEKLAKEALRESESRIKSISNNFIAGMIYQVVIKPDGARTFTYVSDSVRRLYGVSPEEAMADAALIYGRVHEDDIASLTEAENDAVKTLSTFRAEFRIHDPSGETRWSSFVSTPKMMDDGSTRWDGIEFIITERKRAEEALRRSEERLSSFMDSATDGFYLLDSDLRFIEMNRKGLEIAGKNKEEVIGKSITEIVPDVVVSGRYERHKEVIRTGKPYVVEDFIPHPVFGDMHFILKSFKVGNGLGVISADITERKRLEEQLRQAQKMEAIGQLAGGVAHDFNNILAAMMMRLDLMGENPLLDEESREGVKELKREAERAAGLTRQLLIFGRRSVLETRALNVNDVVANLLKMLERLLGEHITLVFERRSASTSVEADAGMLEQALVNLVVNSRDAMPHGGRITLATENVEIGAERAAENPERRAGRFVCLSVSDTGCGMDAATLKRIFEPFFTTKEAGKGTGLGLAMVYGMAAQHRGWVEVESHVGQGTTFWMYLPASAKTLMDAAENGPRAPLTGRETILVVEDDTGVRNALTLTLKSLGYRVFSVSDGREAITFWQDYGRQIDVLLTDMVMPEGMTGLELAEKVRAQTPNVKIIISSGYSAEMTQAGKPTAEGIIYLPKPFPASVLAEILRNCLDEK